MIIKMEIEIETKDELTADQSSQLTADLSTNLDNWAEDSDNPWKPQVKLIEKLVTQG